MTRLEAIQNEIGMLHSSLLNEKKDEIINYLQNNTKEVKIKSEEISIFQISDIISGKASLEDMNILNVGEEIVSANYNKQLDTLIKENISKEVESLDIPYKFIEGTNLSEFTNLKKLNVNGGMVTLSKSAVDKIINTTVIKELSGRFKLQDDLLKESIVIGDSNPTVIYGDMKVISSTRISKSKYIDVKSPDVYKNIDKILKSISDKLDDFEVLRISTHDNKSILMDSDIEYRIYKADDYNYDTSEPYGKETRTVKFGHITSIEEVLEAVEAFKANNLPIDNVVLKLENKDYDNIYLLKKLENEYSFKVEYGELSGKIELSDFIAMRETLDYYKTLIEQYDLSELEKITYAYDLIKSYEYNESDENKQESRRISNIIKTGKIVCVGYAVFLKQLLKELGIESYAISATVPVNGENFGHERNIVKVSDDKYGIEGVYALDATWDSAQQVCKYIDQDGNEQIHAMRNVENPKEILKVYDDLSLYRHFMIPGSEYTTVFGGEKMPKPSSFHSNEDAAVITEVNSDFMYSKALSPEKFMELIETVRLAEGYSPETINQAMEDVLEINNISSEEVTMKR